MSLNLWLTLKGWGWIINKKLIALGLPVIVLKYALLGFFLYQSLIHPQLQAAFFSLGLLVPVIVYIGSQIHQLGNSEEKCRPV